MQQTVDVHVPRSVTFAAMEHPLTRYRHRHGLSLDALAARVGTTKATLSRIESGKGNPSVGLMQRVIQASGGELDANDFVRPAAGEAAE